MKDPDAAAVSVNVVSAAMQQYKQWYRLSDLFSKQSLSGTKEALLRRMAYRGALAVDSVIRNSVFTAGGSSLVGGTAVARTSMKRNTSFQIDVGEVREGVRRLRKDNVPAYGDGFYIGIIHPFAEYDLEGDSTWQNFVMYTEKGVDRAYRGRIGTTFGVDFYVSTQAGKITNGASAGASADVAQTFIFGDEYYGIVKPNDVEIIIKDPFPGSPLNSYASYGWKLWMVAKELKSSRMVRLEDVLSADV